MRKVLLPLIAAVLLALPFTGCADHHHATIVVPTNPSGGNAVGFTCAGANCDATLSGTYVFTIHGVNFRNGTNFVVTGTLIADGSGNITSGMEDSVDDSGQRTLNEAITGTYFVNQDGRGQAILHTNNGVNSNSGQVILRFVLESPAKGELFQIGATSKSVLIDAVGTIALQTALPAPPTGAYIVRLDGEDFGLNPFGAVARIVFSAGSITGLLDENDNGSFLANQNAPGNIGNFSSSRATATLTVNGSVHNFAVYFVSNSKLELIGTDANILLQGSAELQSSFSVSSADFAATAPDQVFALAGSDGSPMNPRAEVGRMTITAPNGVLSNAVEDIQNTSGLSPFTLVDITGSTLVVGLNGRWTSSLINANAPTPSLVGWQISPQKSVVLTTNANIVETGTMRAQTLAGLNTAAVSGNFAEALSGVDTIVGGINVVGADEELTANLLLDGSGGMSGTQDSQDDVTGLNLDIATTGNYTINSLTGRSTGTIDTTNLGSAIPAAGLPVIYYAVDANTIEFLSTSHGRIYLGTLIHQTP